MAEETKKKSTIFATAIIAAGIGASGGYVASDAPVDKINPIVEHDLAFGARISGLEAVGMIVTGTEPHIHVKWTASSSVKAYNVYVDGKKINPDPIVILDSEGRFVAMNKMKINKIYSVTVSSIGMDDKESPQSEAVKVSIK